MSPADLTRPGVRVWDIPTRLFHWMLVAAVATAWITQDADAWLGLHVGAGYTVLGLVLFRLVWGFVGSHHARFASFVTPPGVALRYAGLVLRRQAPRHLGHNPAGGWAVFVLLALLLAVGASGVLLLGVEEGIGPAAGWLPMRWGHSVKEVHEALANGLLLAVGIHLVGVAVESWVHRENLARAMVTGVKAAAPGTPAAGRHAWVALAMAAALLAWAVFWQPQLSGLSRADEAAAPLPAATRVTTADTGHALLQQECGSCHGVFHPSLLPQRSWVALMSEQNRHFGTDLALEAATAGKLLDVLQAGAAEHAPTEAAYKINTSLAADQAPTRITETPYWLRKHRKVADADWALPSVGSRSNCSACHSDAESGAFEDAAIHRPRA